MALMDLQSDLSWYGAKAPGFSPNADRTDTRFINEGASPSVLVSGYTNSGEVLSPIARIASDSFQINDATFSDQGAASRAAQLGTGTKFPLSPLGTNHTFDKVRTGFGPESKYSDIYGVKFGNSGLADTYTANSPIDEMYNKFNLRDDATPNPGYAKQPFILRGIQREGSSDPQRWGIGETTVGKIFSTFDLPRAGILTSGERSVIDAVRIGKFLISPRGIGFLARQFGYQLMNPNTENLLGNAGKIPKQTQIYNPLSAPGQALVQGLLGSGKFTRHTGLTQLPLGGGGEYEGTKSLQRASNILLGMDGEGPLLAPKGRMLKLFKQYDRGGGFFGQPWSALTAPSGPGSILGIGVTTHTRSTITDLGGAFSPYGGIPGGMTAQLQSLIKKEPDAKQLYDTSFGLDTFNRYNTDTSYEDYPNTESHFTNGEVGIPFEGGGRNKADTAKQEVDFTGYETNAYEDFPDRKPTDTNTHDFRTGEDYLSGDDEVGDVFNRFQSPEEFTGGGEAEAADESGTPKVGRLRSKTNTYEELGTAAEERQTKQNTDWNFQENDSHDNTSRIEGSNNLVKRTKNEEETPEGEDDPIPFEERIGFEEAPNVDRSGPLAPQEKGYYKTLGYANLTRDNVRSFSGDAKGAIGGTKYSSEETLEGRYGYNSYPITRDGILDQADPIQSLAGDYEGDIKDLIKFKFQALRTTDLLDSPSEDPIVFRAFINSISDSFAPSWGENQDQGRGDAKIIYEGFGRSISVEFIVPVQSAAELKPCWEKLEKLAKLTYPIYPTGDDYAFTGTYVKTTIGDLYVGEAMYVTDLSYDWDNETPWELEEGSQLPFYTNVSMTLGWIGKHRPDINTHVFTYNATT